MTKYQKAISLVKEGDISAAREVMTTLRSWAWKVGVLRAIAMHQFSTGENLSPIIKEMETAIKRIRPTSELPKESEAAWHCYYLTKFGLGDKAKTYAETITFDTYRTRAYINIALAKKERHESFDQELNFAASIVPRQFGEDIKDMMRQCAFRDGLSVSWWSRGYIDETIPFVEKYLTNDTIKKAAYWMMKEKKKEREIKLNEWRRKFFVEL